MTYNEPTPTTTHRIARILVVGLLVIIVAIAVGNPFFTSSSSTVASPVDVLRDQKLPTRQSVDDHVGQRTKQEARRHIGSNQEAPLDPPLPERGDEQEAPLDPSSLERGDEQQKQVPDRQAERGEAVDPPRAAQLGQVPPALERVPDTAAHRMRREHHRALGEAGGPVQDGPTVFDDEIPEVANLDPELLGALRQAATDAAEDGVTFFVTSGWRSPEYQEHLLREAVSTYGSAEEAARWVATPTTSAHVSGDAVDIGPFDGRAWLSENGASYGLCQIYGNEPWHYELRLEAIDHGCPPMFPDPTHDPRMQ